MIHAHYFTFGQIIEHRYVLPKFARGYSWRVQPHCQILLNDLIKAQKQNRSWFWGSIVLQKKAGVGFEDAYFELLDGASRLTALSLLWGVMRALANKPQTTSPKPNVESVVSMGDTCIAIEENDRVLETVKYFEDNLRAYSQEEMERLAQHLLHQTGAVITFIDPEKNTLEIYENVQRNAVPFGLLDEFRQYCFRVVSVSEHESFVRLRFRPFESKLHSIAPALKNGDDGITAFFKIFLASKGKHAIGSAGVWSFDSVLNTIESSNGLIEFFDDALWGLEVLEALGNAQANLNILPIPSEFISAIGLARVKASVYYPLILALAFAYRQGRMPLADAAPVFDALENVAIRCTLCNANPNDGVSKAVEYTNQTKNFDAKTFVALLTGDGYPDDTDVFKNCVTRKFYNGNSAVKSLLRLLLIKINRYISTVEGKDASRIVDFNGAKIEHILPRNREAWKPYLQSNGQWDDLSEEPDIIHCMGNLTLLFDGEIIGCKTIDEKKKLYEASPILLTRRLCEYKVFGPKQIQERGQALAEIIVKHVYPNLKSAATSKALPEAKKAPAAVSNSASAPAETPSLAPASLPVSVAQKPADPQPTPPSRAVVDFFPLLFFHFIIYSYTRGKMEATFSIDDFRDYLNCKNYYYASDIVEILRNSSLFTVVNDGKSFKFYADVPKTSFEQKYFDYVAKNNVVDGWVFLNDLKNDVSLSSGKNEIDATALFRNREYFVVDKDAKEAIRFRWNVAAAKAPVQSAAPATTSGTTKNTEPSAVVAMFNRFVAANPPKNGHYLLGEFGTFLKNENFAFSGKLSTYLKGTECFDIYAVDKKDCVKLADKCLAQKFNEQNVIAAAYREFVFLNNVQDGWISMQRFATFLTEKGQKPQGKFINVLTNLGLFDFQDSLHNDKKIRLKAYSPGPSTPTKLESKPTADERTSEPQKAPAGPTTSAPATTSDALKYIEPRPIVVMFAKFVAFNPSENGHYLLSDFGTFLKNENFVFSVTLSIYLKGTGCFKIYVFEEKNCIDLTDEWKIQYLTEQLKIVDAYREFVFLNNVQDGWISMQRFAVFLADVEKKSPEDFINILDDPKWFDFEDSLHNDKKIRLKICSSAPTTLPTTEDITVANNSSFAEKNDVSPDDFWGNKTTKQLDEPVKLMHEPRNEVVKADAFGADSDTDSGKNGVDFNEPSSEKENEPTHENKNPKSANVVLAGTIPPILFHFFNFASPMENFSLHEQIVFSIDDFQNYLNRKNISYPNSLLKHLQETRYFTLTKHGCRFAVPQTRLKRQLRWKYFVCLSSNEIGYEWVPLRLLSSKLLPPKIEDDHLFLQIIRKLGIFEIDSSLIYYTKVRLKWGDAQGSSQGRLPTIVHYFFKFTALLPKPEFKERYNLQDFKAYLDSLGVVYSEPFEDYLSSSKQFRVFSDGTFTLLELYRRRYAVFKFLRRLKWLYYKYVSVYQAEHGWILVQRFANFANLKRFKYRGKFSDVLKKSRLFEINACENAPMVRLIKKTKYLSPDCFLLAEPRCLETENNVVCLQSANLESAAVPVVCSSSEDERSSDDRPDCFHSEASIDPEREFWNDFPPSRWKGAVKVWDFLRNLRSQFLIFCSNACPVSDDGRYSFDEFYDFGIECGLNGAEDWEIKLLQSGLFDFWGLENHACLRLRTLNDITLFDAKFSFVELSVEDWFYLFSRFNPGLHDDDGYFSFLDFCRFLGGKLVLERNQTFVNYVLQRKTFELDLSRSMGARIRFWDGNNMEA